MAFSLSGSTITQSGTDTSYAGLNGIAGVTRLATGSGYLYYMPTLVLSVTSTLTIADPSKDTIICSRLSIASTGKFKSGSFAVDGVTPLRGGVHFVTVGGVDWPDSFGGASYEVAGGGESTLIGGSYQTAQSIHFGNNAVIREYGVTATAMRPSPPGSPTTDSLRYRSFTSNLIKRNCEHYDYGFDLFRVPSEFSVKAFGSAYVGQYVGSFYLGADARFVASALSNTDGAADFDNWGAGWVELYNCAKGANLAVTCSANRVNHCVPLYQDVNFTVTNFAGQSQQNIRLRCVDAPVSNNPTVAITTTGSLKTWDFRGPQTYTATTDPSGKATLTPVLQVWHGSTNLKNLRFPSSTATVRLIGYAVRQQDVQVVLGADTAIEKGVAMVAANDITLTEAQAGALTGVAFAASGATDGTVTVTEARTAAEIWQAWRYWKGLIANADSADSWEYTDGRLNAGAWSVVNSSTITGSILTTGTVTGAGTVTGSVEDSTGVRVTIRKSGGGNFNIAARAGTTGSYTDLGYTANTGSITYTVPKGQPVEVAMWSLGYMTYRREISTAAGGVVFDAEMTPNSSIDTALDVSGYLADISVSNGGGIFQIIFDADMDIPGIEAAKAIVHRIVGLEIPLRAGLPPTGSTIIEILADEIRVNKPYVFLTLGTGATNVTQRGYINAGPALVIDPSYAVNPRRLADNLRVELPLNKPTLDASVLALAVRTELATELGRIDATVSSRLPTAGYTAPAPAADIAAAVEAAILTEGDGRAVLQAIADKIANENLSASTVAAQVRTELAAELSRMDAPVSSRLAASAYTAPTAAPTAAQNAAAVRTNLATELARLDAAVSSRSASGEVVGANVVRINGVELQGAGTAGNSFRPKLPE